jgi:hypothetical protein
MQLEISEYNSYIVIAGNGNKLNRYKVTGNLIKNMMMEFERVVYIGLLMGFEIYTKDPETGTTGWDIHWVEGVKEKIQALYPNFDTFITQDYPSSGQTLVKFDKIEKDDYQMKAFVTDHEDEMTDARINTLFDCLIDNDIHATIDYIIAKGSTESYEALIEKYDSQA